MKKKLILSATAIMMLTMTGSNQVFASETSIINTHMAVTQRNQTIELMGLNGEFAQVSLTKGETQGTLKTFSNGNRTVHVYYGDSIYTTISIKDKNKKEVYNKKFIGKQRLANATENLPLAEGSTIEIYHDEPWRLGANEDALKQKWDATHFKYVVKNGQLEAITAVTQSIDLCGLNGEFAQVSFIEGETEGKLKTFSNGNRTVHVYYGDSIYTTISIKDKNKKEVYNKKFIGKQRLANATENLPLTEGSTIEIYHDEPWRLGANDGALKQKWDATHFKYVVENGKLIPYTDVPATFESFADDAVIPSFMAPTDDNLRSSIVKAFNPTYTVPGPEHFIKQYYYLLGGLDLSHLKAAKKDIRNLQGIQYLDRISSLNLSYNDNIKDYSPLATRKMSTLNSLTGNNLRMTNEQLSFMEKAKTYLPNLGYMDFNNNQITDLSSLKDITSRLGQKFEGEFKNQEIVLSDTYYTDGPLYKIDNPIKDYQGNPVAPKTINNDGIYNSETNTIEWATLPPGHTALRFTWNEEWYYSPFDDQSEDNTPAINFSGNYTRYANIR